MKTAAIFLILVCLPLAEGGKKITLATHDQYPLTYLLPDHSAGGSAAAPVASCLRQMGWSYEFVFMPWARAQEMTKLGMVDGFFAATENQERSRYAAASRPIAYQKVNWYLLKQASFHPESRDFKKSAKVGGYIGSNMLKMLKQNGYNVTGEPRDPDQLFTMLLNRRFDACLANDYNFSRFIQANPSLSGSFRSEPYSANPLVVYFSKKFIAENPDFISAFNKMIP